MRAVRLSASLRRPLPSPGRANSCSCVIPVSPEIEWSPDQLLTLRAGENVKLSCSITGRPVPQVVWYKDGKEIDKRIMMDMEISTDIGTSRLFIRDADRNHRGLYTVEAKNSSGTKKADVNVRVQGWSTPMVLTTLGASERPLVPAQPALLGPPTNDDQWVLSCVAY